MQNRETKTFVAEVKAGGDLKAGEFTAVVSVFDNVDLGGDVIRKGAFTNAIAQMKANGDVLPIVWSHEWDNPMAHVGYADPNDIIETDEGLQLKGILDVDRPFAEQVSHLLKTRRVKEFSFGYFVNDAEMIDDPELGKVRELKDIDIFEAGPTLKGMNPATRLLQAASALKDAPAKGIEESEYDFSPAQRLQYDAMEKIAETIGKFDQTTGANGAHYAPADANPFKAEGLMCQNCAFYEGPRGCEVVAGDIDPEAICKLWIIPEALLAGAPTDAGADSMDGKEATLEEAAPIADDTQTPDGEALGDNTGKINLERLADLIAMPRHKE